MRIIAASAPLRRSPRSRRASRDRSAPRRIRHRLRRARRGWAWAQLERDQYVGYLPATRRSERRLRPTHRVAALRTHAYPGPAIKLPPRMALSLGAQLMIVRQDGDFSVSDDGLLSLVAAASLRLKRERTGLGRGRGALYRGALSLGRPDVGGHQTSRAWFRPRSWRPGSHRHATVTCRRRRWASLIAIDDPAAPLARGDLVFWKGHVGIMRNLVTLLHANGSAH